MKKIAIVAGGYSGEYEISIQSAATIAKQLDATRYQPYTIVIGHRNWAYTAPDGKVYEVDKNDFSLPLPTGKVTFDAVFIGIHGTPGEDGRLQGYFDMLGIPYTGSGSVSSAITFNKAYCNKIVRDLGIVHIAKSVHALYDQPETWANLLDVLHLPVFVKPAEGGSSVGMSKVKTAEELPAALEKAFREDKQVLVEEFVKGRELTIGLYRGADGVLHPLPITEIVTTKEFFDYEAKYTPGKSQEITPAQTSAAVTSLVQRTAMALYNKLNCKGIVRVDFIYETHSDQLFFLEINTMPGQSENSIVPQQVRAAGLTLTEFYGIVLEACMKK
ncbi:D-alanine-D-alanine ligase [Chitinophaga costaii]|uniref:D-alanine--D-alanine ligase n=1 Tax=Chitinophaga costaii TaxID=1335309 RepID=A0A1C4ES05_9BACT|nr:D-alanine--D-alanine ligase [Chitinophaga costaii]PUZ22554.1 D-alanine--D-alanine ligase [Chitinophaga costaii]SCC46377.1 D-alanine-D-alanine ligase [Chitinophaga costaii]